MRTLFFLYFGDEDGARQAASVVDGRGFDVNVRPPDGHVAEWAVHAGKDMRGRITS